MEEPKPVVFEAMELIARLVSVRAPREGEGMFTMSEFELHSGAISRGGLILPYRPDHGLLGSTFAVIVNMEAIPAEDYRDIRVGTLEKRSPPPSFGVA